MSIISTQEALEAFCQSVKDAPFITVDTEFLRDKTYYPKLCLIQIAGPETKPVAIDPLVEDLDLAPVFDLMYDDSIVKVFHAARQDMEIFFNLTGKIPHPLFDTQVAAMVCGHGEQAGYYSLVNDICGLRIDKGAQFTDWSRRPLSDKQLSYALDDVTHLRQVYLTLKAGLEERGRIRWVREEMAILTSNSTYENHPENAYKRIKVRTAKPKMLAVLQAVAGWRESEAQRRDVPRNRVMRDDALVDIAVHAPQTPQELSHARSISSDMAHGRLGKALLEAVKKGLATDFSKFPMPKKRKGFPGELVPVLEMLKMLLRIQCSEHHVATKLVANSKDLEAVAMDDEADVRALRGWRREIFGEDALALKHGRMALKVSNGQIERVKL